LEALTKQFSQFVIPLILVALVFVIVFVLKTFLGSKTTQQAEHEALPYALRKSLLTNAERSFFGVLEEVASHARYHVFTQIPLGSLVYVERGTGSYQSYRNRVDRKTLDFVLASKDTLAPVLAVELDDSTREREDRRERDAFVDEVLAKAGLPLMHVRARAAYDPKSLAQDISDAVGGR